MISVLIPSRKRADALASSVRSLRTRAEDADAVEILVAADPDDQETIAAVRKLGVKLHVTPERYGYPGLHHYYNLLAKEASGDWLFIWNDDTLALTRHWDEIIRKSPPGVLHPQIDHVPEHNSFPVIPASWFRLLGHICPTYGVDLWWHDLGRMTCTAREIPVRVRHARTTDDLTAVERDARDIRGELAGFDAPESRWMRCSDANKIQEHLGKPPVDFDKMGITIFSLKD